MDLLVNIDVDDLSKAIAFYQRAVGLRLGRRFGLLGAEMLGTSLTIYLLAKPDGTRPSTTTDEVRRYRRHCGWALIVQRWIAFPTVRLGRYERRLICCA
jgi:extradiol dioxygenase family protein